MRIIVDRDRCEGHGQCAIAAPELFRLDEDGKLHHEDEVPTGLEALAEDAMDVCPTQAITLEQDVLAEGDVHRGGMDVCPTQAITLED